MARRADQLKRKLKLSVAGPDGAVPAGEIQLWCIEGDYELHYKDVPSELMGLLEDGVANPWSFSDRRLTPDDGALFLNALNRHMKDGTDLDFRVEEH